MGHRYAVLGAGLQGTAAAFDLARFGEPESVTIFDKTRDKARRAAERVNHLLEQEVVSGESLDVRDGGDVEAALRDVDAAVSAVPYFFNPSIALACIHAGVHVCDLGGNTDVSRRVLSLDAEAREAGVCIVPDCGLAPGLSNILAVYGMGFLDRTDSVRIRCGGLPQNPKPPLFYKVVFNIMGLTNEYFGEAVVLKDGKVKRVETFSGLEEIDFGAPVGRCEAFVTSGGSSTCPESFEGKVREFEYKTVRYPGHYERFKVIRDLGLLDLEPVELHGSKVVPRDLFHAVVKPGLAFPDDKDLVVLRVSVCGWKGDHAIKMVFEVMDFQDESFSAMQRTTGWSASIISQMMSAGEIAPGARPLELAIDGRVFVERFKRRGLRFTESMTRTIAGEERPFD